MKKRSIKYVHSDYMLQLADANPAVKMRASMTHELIVAYGLLKHLEVLPPKRCNSVDLARFHTRDYLQQLAKCAPSSAAGKCSATDGGDGDESDVETDSVAAEYGLGFDCPLWPRLYDYVCCIAGATMTACDALCRSSSNTDVIINLTGGWHHAQRDKAGGYCYVNDIVLGLLVLRKRFKRILYLDLDVHHGDGVQFAFEATKHVFTLSFHQHEHGFYPGTGAFDECGFGTAKGYSANFPYHAGITGINFQKYFKRITQLILQRYKPDACVIQCGADTIVGDPLGGTNLVPSDLIACILFVLQHNVPTLLLGGGGYNFANASRYWTLLVGALLNQQLSDDIPDETPHFLQYGPDYSINIAAKQLKDSNTIEYLEGCATSIEANLEKYNVAAI